MPRPLLTHAASRRIAIAAAAALIALSLPAMAQTTPVDLARKNGCLACHGMVHKQVGPGFAQIAQRYRGDSEAAARLAGKIRDGSVGTWGRVIMPRQTLVSAADAQALAQWVLSQPLPR